MQNVMGQKLRFWPGMSCCLNQDTTLTASVYPNNSYRKQKPFSQLLGYPISNFETLTERQPLLTNVNHSAAQFWQEVHREPCNEIESLSFSSAWLGLKQWSSGFWLKPYPVEPICPKLKALEPNSRSLQSWAIYYLKLEAIYFLLFF